MISYLNCSECLNVSYKLKNNRKTYSKPSEITIHFHEVNDMVRLIFHDGEFCMLQVPQFIKLLRVKTTLITHFDLICSNLTCFLNKTRISPKIVPLGFSDSNKQNFGSLHDYFSAN